MQTALHIVSLVDELRREVVGGEIQSTEFYRKRRTACFFVRKQKATSALGFVFHPAGWGTFCVPAGKVRLDTSEKPWPIFGLDHGTVVDVAQHGIDRIFELTVEVDGEKKQVVFEAIGPNGNLWLLDRTRGRQAVLRNRDFIQGEPYQAAPVSDRLDPFSVTAGRLQAAAEAESGLALLTVLKKHLAGLNESMAREIITRANVNAQSVGDLENEDWAVVAEQVRQVSSFFRSPDKGYLYTTRGGVVVYPFKLKSVSEEPEKFKTLSLAVLELTQRQQTATIEEDREKTVTQAVSRGVKRLERRIKNLQHDIETAADYDTYKRHGELLQINMGSLRKGMSEAVVDDIYHDPPQSVTIALEPALSPAENIDEYFKKHRKGREGLELLQRRLEISRGELEELEQIQAALNVDFESADQRFQSEILSLMPRGGEKDKTDAGPRLPYREVTLSTGLTIFVGKDGTDNDRTTFEFARPYEFWFHTQQCPGSHVVMKFPNKKFEPSKREIEETAAIAAWHSKARNDSLVPVVYTERRYVRKPRKAKPGLVTVEREKSVMVEPRKPD